MDHPVYENALQQQEIMLRDSGIDNINYLDKFEDRYDAIDLTCNNLNSLTAPKKMRPRLKTLLLGRNKIQNISADFGSFAPGLQILSLADNYISDFDQLNFLKDLPSLTQLNLVGCPLTKIPDYRARIISIQPGILDLDFQKVSKSERETASHVMKM